MALFTFQHFWQCVREGWLGIDPKCPSIITWQIIVLDPFLLLACFFLFLLSLSAVSSRSIVAKRTLQWWGILLVLFICVNLFVAAGKNDSQLLAPGLFSTQHSRVTQHVSSASFSGEILPESIDYVQPVTITIDDSCLKSEDDPKNGLTLSMICENLGVRQLTPTVSVVLKPKQATKTVTVFDPDYVVYLEFYEGNEKLDVPRYYFPSFAESNASWFRLDISYLGSEAIYVSDTGGHETYPSHFFFNGTWNELYPWELVRASFPDSLEPPFSLRVSHAYLTVTEEQYFSDTVYSDTADRKTTRLVFVLDRLSKNILSISRIAR